MACSSSVLNEVGTEGHEKSQISDERIKISDSAKLSSILNSAETSNAAQPPSLPDRDVQVESEARPDDVGQNAGDTSSASVDMPAHSLESLNLTERESGTTPSRAEGEGASNIVKTDSLAGTDGSSRPPEHEE